MEQYLITEKNEWEDETFGYITHLSTQDAAIIAELFNQGDRWQETWSIELLDGEDALDKDKVKLVNKYSSNSYMSRLQWVTISQELITAINKKLQDGDKDLEGYLSSHFNKGQAFTKISS